MKPWFRWICSGLCIWICASVRADALRVGGGFGRQVGNISPPQQNIVVDAAYEFYAVDWHAWELSMGVGMSRLWDDYDNRDLLIVSALPTLRCYFAESEHLKPYVFATTGPSYLTETHLGHQLLGGHIAFNDFFGVGTYVGHNRIWSVEWCWRHVSNADLYQPNAGIDVPFCILVGRRI